MARLYAGLLTPMQERVFMALRGADRDVVVSYEALTAALYDEPRAINDRLLKVLVCRLRRILDLEIPCVRGAGYLLSQADRAKLRVDSPASAALKARNAARAA